MRLRVFVAVALAALAPHIIVIAWSFAERPLTGRAWGDVRDAVESVSKALAAGTLSAPVVERTAREKKVWIRVLSEDSSMLFDANADDPMDALQPVDAFFFGAESATAKDIDEDLEPLPQRRSVHFALERRERFVDCDRHGALVCQGAERVALPNGAVVVHAQKSSARAVQKVYTLRHQLLRVSLITLPLALLLALYATSRVIRPIERLRNQVLARAHAAGPDVNLVGQDDEVGSLAEAFNAMLGALDEKRAANEAFVADLVHEMKSPVAAVRATAESLAGNVPDAERAARLSRVLGESAKKLDRLVTDFLELARAEAGMPEDVREPVDVAALAKGLAQRIRDDERYARIKVDVDAEGPAVVVGVPHRLETCLRELMDNAASFAGPEGRVSVNVAVKPTEIVVVVEDTGPGIAPADLPNVFRRFYTTRGQARGTGLGLALVRAVVEAHGGRVSANAKTDAGAAFEVHLPRKA